MRSHLHLEKLKHLESGAFTTPANLGTCGMLCGDPQVYLALRGVPVFPTLCATPSRKRGVLLAALREDLDLTQVDLAAALDVTPRTVKNWEKHGRGPERRYRDLKELQGSCRSILKTDKSRAGWTVRTRPSGTARRVS
jgi:DNA-binding XRE family transcriptional regulator